MQIVIDIPEDVIECAKSSPNYYPTYHFEKIWRAIANGIPLDKIRAEIEWLKLHKAQFLTSDNKVCIDSQEVFDIIDHYKAERSDKK